MNRILRTKSLLTLTLLALLTTQVNAQVMGFREPVVNVGVKVGGMASVLASAPVKTSPGPLAGIYVTKKLGRAGIRLEVLGTMLSYKTKFPASYYSLYSPGMDTLSKGDLTGIYASAPLLVEYQWKERLMVQFGPQFSYLVNLTDNNGAFSKIYGEGKFLKSTDFAVVAGAEYILSKKIRAGLRIMIGVTDVNNSTYYLVPRSWTSTGAQIAISYKIL